MRHPSMTRPKSRHRRGARRGLGWPLRPVPAHPDRSTRRGCWGLTARYVGLVLVVAGCAVVRGAPPLLTGVAAFVGTVAGAVIVR